MTDSMITDKATDTAAIDDLAALQLAFHFLDTDVDDEDDEVIQ
ncbi:hypothetical protein [Gordonia sp. 852002-51296_SCH5728562-b]|nr:hypothetical protein [Gordonia sp. 852002-51296_SCH5728562-b]